jgi:C1A family cysteine protease
MDGKDLSKMDNIDECLLYINTQLYEHYQKHTPHQYLRNLEKQRDELVKYKMMDELTKPIVMYIPLDEVKPKPIPIFPCTSKENRGIIDR